MLIVHLASLAVSPTIWLQVTHVRGTQPLAWPTPFCAKTFGIEHQNERDKRTSVGDDIRSARISLPMLVSESIRTH